MSHTTESHQTKEELAKAQRVGMVRRVDLDLHPSAYYAAVNRKESNLEVETFNWWNVGILWMIMLHYLHTQGLTNMITKICLSINLWDVWSQITSSITLTYWVTVILAISSLCLDGDILYKLHSSNHKVKKSERL